MYDAITPLCKALQDPDLDGWEMSRFVVGARRQTSQEVVAFVVVGDKKERVFFTDLFFDQRMLQHEYANLLTAPFNIAGHARASALIHEFSHLYSRTEDICYTDVRRPFLDLIDTSTKRGRDEYALLKDYQDNVLSLRTPFGQLFSRWFPSSGSSGSSSDSGGSGGSGNWVSMDSTNSHDLAAKAIMEATATTSINDARIAFLNTASADKRIDTILRNADSVTQLICEMGRELDP